MSNYSTYQDAIKTAEQSAGTTTAKYEAYLDSIEAHLNTVTTAWETFTQKLGQSDVIKKLVDASAWLVDKLDRILSILLTMISANIGYKLSKGSLGIGSSVKNFLLGPGHGAKKQKETAVTSRLDKIKDFVKQIRDRLKRGKKGKIDKDEEDTNLKPSGKQKGKAAALAGIAAGVSGYTTGPNNAFTKGLYGTKDISIDDIESDTTDRVINGAISGGLAAVGTYFLGPIGGALGSAIGNEFGTLFKWLRHRDEIERKQRVQDALKVVDAINKANESVKKIDEQISKRGSTDFDAVAVRDSIYSTLNSLYAAPNGRDVIRDFEERMSAEAKDLGIAEGKDANYYLDLLVNGTDEQAEAVDRILNATLDINKAFQTYASQEQTRYDNAKKVEEVRSTARKFGLDNTGTVEDLLKVLNDKYNQDYANLSKSEQEELNKAILTLQQVQTSYAEMAQEVNKSAFSFGVGNSGVGGWSAADVYNKSLEEAILNTIEEVERSGAAVGITLRDYNGDITKEARDFAVSTLKDYGNLGVLFKKETTALYKLLGDKNKRDTLGGVLGGFTEAIKRIQRNDGWLADYEEAVGKGLFSGTAQQYRSYMLQLDASSTELESFAKALGVSEDDLKDHTELLDISLKELSRSVSETAESMKKMTGYIDSIISMGGLSVTQLQEILKENPLLIKKANGDGTYSLDASVENIFNNIWNKTMGKQADTLYNQAILNDRYSNQTIIDSFREALENAGEDASYLAGVSNLSTLLDTIRGSGKKTNHLDILNTLLASSFTEDIETQKSVLAQLTSYQTKVIDIQIDNLNSQKEAISKVNDEYKKQIDLVKAQQALENAKNEKRKVYRAGIGWTYEADQEAIQKAKEDLDQKENNVKEENLQYQIDLLQKSKEILEGLPTEMSFQQSKKFFETFENSLSSAGTSVSDFVVAINKAYTDLSSINFDEILAKITLQNATNTGVAEAITQGRNSGLTDLTVWNGKGRPQGMTYSDYAHYKNDYNKALKNNPNLTWEEFVKSLKGFSLGPQTLTGSFSSSSLVGTDAWEEEAKAYNNRLNMLNGPNGFFELMHVKDWRNKTAEEINKMYGLTGNNALDDTEVKQWLNLYDAFYGREAVNIKPYGEKKNLLDGRVVKIDIGNGYYLYSGLKNTHVSSDVEEQMANDPPFINTKGYKQAITDYPTTDIVVVDKNGICYRLENGKWVKSVKTGKWYNDIYFIKSANEFDNSLGTDGFHQQNIHVSAGSAGSGKSGRNLNAVFDYLKSHKFGTYNFSGGSSLINELGTEGIVTPQGTITALPSHTGIVPADLTRNLYQLGELSPNLIKGLSTLKTEANRFNSTEDNSMHVNDLNITVNADSGYDFNKLLSEARQYMAITRHNK